MLAWFRRHAKILMVVLGSAAMAIFGLGPVFDELSSRSRRGSDPQAEVIASWKGGDITRVDLNQMEKRHYQTQRFLGTLFNMALEKKGDTFTSFAIPIAPIRDGQREMIDDQLISRFLMAERAKLEGVVVSDGMVNDYIASYSGDAGFSSSDLKAINEKANNRYCSLLVVREHLKMELLANMMQTYSLAGIPMIPNPTESMELWGRTMDQVDCEVLPVEVEKFVSQVTETPTVAELKTLYEEGKYEFPDFTGEKPGFKIGRKLNVQYFVANFDTYLQNEINKLTDEEVQKEYDRLVAADDDLVMEDVVEVDDAIELKDPPPLLPGDNDPPPALPGDKDTPPAPGDSETPSDVEPPPAGSETSGNQPETEATETPAKAKQESGDKNDGAKAKTEGTNVDKSEAKPDQSNPEDAEKAQPDQESDKSTGKQSDQSTYLIERKDQFVSTVNQEDPAKQDPAKQDSEKQESEKQESEKQDPAKQETDQPEDTEEKASKSEAADTATQTPVDQKPATDPPVKTDDSADADSNEKPAPPVDPENLQEKETPGEIANALLDVGADKDEAKVTRKPKPLKDVVESVKRSMSEDAARAAMEESLKMAGVLVQDHFEKLLRYEYDGSSKKQPVPEPLDIEKIAKDYKLEAKETGLVDNSQIAEDTIGQVRVFMQIMSQGRQVPQLVPVGQLVFNDFSDLKLYNSKTVEDTWGTQSSYLYWLSEKVETRIPSLDECRPEIEKFWKQGKAFEKALAEAESMKARVDADVSKKMSEVFPVRAVKTGAFTWFSSFGNTGYSNPIGVTSPGEAFMQVAFSLEANQLGVAANETKDTVYVIQAVIPSKSAIEIGNDYLDDQFFKLKRIPNEVLRASQRYGLELNSDWNQELQDTMEFKFVDR